MKKLVFAFTALILLPTLSFASAGGVGSGGGKGVICRDKTTGKVKSVELLDLWEAQNLYGRTIKKTNVPIATQVQDALSNLTNAFNNSGGYWSNNQSAAYSQYFSDKVNTTSAYFLTPNSTAHWLKGAHLEPTPDSLEQAVPDNCDVEQIVTYDDSIANPNILINKDLWDRLDVTSQAALIVHESVYTFLRTTADEQNSLRVRRAVGYVFGGNVFKTMASVAAANSLDCNDILSDNHISEFIISPQSPNHTAILPETLESQPMIGFFAPPDAQTFSYDIIDLMKADPSCAPQYTHVMAPNGLTNSIFVINFTSWSPIDLNVAGQLLMTCEDGKRVAYIPPQDWGGLLDQTPPVGSTKAFCFPFTP